MAFREIDQQDLKFWLFIESSKDYARKNLETTLLFINVSKSFDSREKIEQILLAYILPKKVTAKRIHLKKLKSNSS